MSTTSTHLALAEASKKASTLQSHRSLYVGGLEETIKDSMLRAAMIPFGNIKSVDIPMDYQKGTNRGFGFVVRVLCFESFTDVHLYSFEACTIL